MADHNDCYRLLRQMPERVLKSFAAYDSGYKDQQSAYHEQERSIEKTKQHTLKVAEETEASEISRATTARDTALQTTRGERERAEESAKAARDAALTRAEERRNRWNARRDKFQKAIAGTARAAEQIHTMQQSLGEDDLLSQEQKQHISQQEAEIQDLRIQIDEKLKQLEEAYNSQYNRETSIAHETFGRKTHDAEERYQSEEKNAKRACQDARDRSTAERQRTEQRAVNQAGKSHTQNQQQYRVKIQGLEKALQEGLTEERYLKALWGAWNQIRGQQPSHAYFQNNATNAFPDGLLFGSLVTDLELGESASLKSELLAAYGQEFLDGQSGHPRLRVPWGFSFRENASLLLRYAAGQEEAARRFLRNMGLQIFLSVPAGKAWCTFLDPAFAADTFAMFMPLGRADPQVIDTTIWGRQNDIEARLDALGQHIAHMIADVFQGQYQNIVEYNQSVGPLLAEPLRFLFIMGYPAGFSREAQQKLANILNTGGKAGVFTLIAAAENDLKRVLNNGEIPGDPFSALPCLTIDKKSRFRPSLQAYPYLASAKSRCWLESDASPGGQNQPDMFTPSLEALMGRILASTRRVVDWERMVEHELLDHSEKWFTYDARKRIQLPVGLEGRMLTMLTLGDLVEGRVGCYHALIGGITGSGKSMLLKSLICSCIARYSPQEVQLYLLDFKEGVEMRCFAQAGLKNFRTIALDSEPEYARAVLKHLKNEMKTRAQLFRNVGVTHFHQYNSQVSKEYRLPRLLVLFDEIQKICPPGGEDGGVATECINLLTDLVTQGGNAFGIHIILSSQSFAGLPLPPILFGNMEARFALHSAQDAAQALLGADHAMLATVTGLQPMEGIFNDKLGAPGNDHRLFFPTLERDRMEGLLTRFAEAQRERDFPDSPTRILLSALRDDPNHPISRFVAQGEVEDSGPLLPRLFVGERLEMEPGTENFGLRLEAYPRENLLLISSDLRRAGDVMLCCAISFLYETLRLDPGEFRQSDALLTVIDFPDASLFDTPSDAPSFQPLHRVIQKKIRRTCAETATALIRQLCQLNEELEKQKPEGEQEGRRQMLLFNGLERALPYFEQPGTAARFLPPGATPMGLLRKLAEEGPQNGVYLVAWSERPEELQKHFAGILPAFRHRIAYALEPKHIAALMDGMDVPSTMGENNALLSSPQGQFKIRLYTNPPDWPADFAKQLDKRLKEEEGRMDG